MISVLVTRFMFSTPTSPFPPLSTLTALTEVKHNSTAYYSRHINLNIIITIIATTQSHHIAEYVYVETRCLWRLKSTQHSIYNPNLESIFEVDLILM